MTGYPPAENDDQSGLDDLLNLLQFDRVESADILADEDESPPGDDSLD
jgi:hypothetical protein